MTTTDVLFVESLRRSPTKYTLLIHSDTNEVSTLDTSKETLEHDFSQLLTKLLEQGLHVNKFYVPVWLSSTLQTVIQKQMPDSEILINYNE